MDDVLDVCGNLLEDLLDIAGSVVDIVVDFGVESEETNTGLAMMAGAFAEVSDLTMEIQKKYSALLLHLNAEENKLALELKELIDTLATDRKRGDECNS